MACFGLLVALPSSPPLVVTLTTSGRLPVASERACSSEVTGSGRSRIPSRLLSSLIPIAVRELRKPYMPGRFSPFFPPCQFPTLLWVYVPVALSFHAIDAVWRYAIGGVGWWVPAICRTTSSVERSRA